MSDHITTFAEAKQLLLEKLDREHAEIRKLCADDDFMMSDSDDFKEAVARPSYTIQSIFRVKKSHTEAFELAKAKAMDLPPGRACSKCGLNNPGFCMDLYCPKN